MSEPKSRPLRWVDAYLDDLDACSKRVDGFGAAFAWAISQDFDPDHAERVRREAWGRSDTRRLP